MKKFVSVKGLSHQEILNFIHALKKDGWVSKKAFMALNKGSLSLDMDKKEITGWMPDIGTWYAQNGYSEVRRKDLLPSRSYVSDTDLHSDEGDIPAKGFRFVKKDPEPKPEPPKKSEEERLKDFFFTSAHDREGPPSW